MSFLDRYDIYGRVKKVGGGKWKLIGGVLYNLALIIVFGFIYGRMMTANPKNWASPYESTSDFSFMDGFYLSVIVHTSVGFGDFYPKGATGKSLVVLHSVLVFIGNLIIGML